MIGALVSGALAGYAVAIPVGAIAVLIIETAVRRGFRAGFAAGAGAATADGIYATLAIVGGAVIAGSVAPLRSPISVISAIVLFAIAGRGLALLARPARERRQGAPIEAPAGAPTAVGTYGRFVGLTLVNPMTVVYFAAVVLGLPSLGGTAERVVFAVAAFFASLSWQTLLAAFGAFLHHRLPPSAALATSLAGNLIIAFFAVRIALNA